MEENNNNEINVEELTDSKLEEVSGGKKISPYRFTCSICNYSIICTTTTSIATGRTMEKHFKEKHPDKSLSQYLVISSR